MAMAFDTDASAGMVKLGSATHRCATPRAAPSSRAAHSR
jgi:hypothetical protein